MNEAVIDEPQTAATQAPATAPDAPPQLSRRFVIAITILLGSFSGLGPLAIDMYLPSFPSLAKQFGATLPEVELTLTAYLFGLAFGQLLYGPAADRFGRKRPLYVGLVIFVLASIGCAFAPSVRALMILRTLQAIGGCAEMVIARAIVRDLFDARAAVRVFSSLMLVMGVAPILAPLLGGWIVEHLSWRGVFWILVAAGSLCFLGAVFLLPESLPPQRRERHSLGALLQVYRRLFSHRIYIVHTLTVSLGCTAIFAYVGGSPGLFMDTYGVPARYFGLLFGANAFALISMSQLNSYLSHRIDPRVILSRALAVSLASSALLLVLVLTGWGGAWTVCPCLFVFIGTFGFIFPTTMALAMAPHSSNAGNASALLGCFQFLISALGGIIVTHLPFSGPVAMAVMILASMGLIPVVRWAGRLHQEPGTA